MTANPNQPNRGNQGGASRPGAQDTEQLGQHATGKQGQGGNVQGQQRQDRDEGNRFGKRRPGVVAGPGRGEDTARYLDAIEENVSKLRSALGGSSRSDDAEREGGASRTGRDASRTDANRSDSSRNL